MPAPTNPFQPYAAAHKTPSGPGDARPTAQQVLTDAHAAGALRGKTILITGASAGIGVETARALYETGAQLYLGVRNVARTEGIVAEIVAKAQIQGAPRPQVLELHLDSLAQIRTAAKEFTERSGGQLNILINNAGVMACPYTRTTDGFELQFGTNHLGHFLLFQLLKPLLIATAARSGTPSRVINVSSAGHRRSGIRWDDWNWASEAAYNKFLAYGQSKTANIYMANELERRYGATQGVHGWSVHPGAIATELGRHMQPGELEAMGIDKIQHLFKSPEQGAATTVWAAVAEHFEGKNGGRYLADVGESAPMVPGEEPVPAGSEYAPHAYDKEAEKRLWKLSCEAVGVPEDD